MNALASPIPHTTVGKPLEALPGLRNVILHVGHPKTGSSALQSWLAQNRNVLASAGLIYPDHASFDHARRFGITSGNAVGGPEFLFERILEADRDSAEGDTLLFSSEVLFWKLDDIVERLQPLRDRIALTVVFFIREPLEMACSSYHQAVKRNGETQSFEQCVLREAHLLEAERAHRMLRREGIDVRVLNYGTRRGNIVGAFFDALGLGEAVAQQGEAAEMPARVNRSLSRSELELVRAVNRVSGREAGWRLSDMLVEHAPEVTPYRHRVSEEVRTEFGARFEHAFAYFNEMLPAVDALRLSSERRHEEPARPELDRLQIEALAVAYGEMARELEDTARESDALRKEMRCILRYPWKRLGRFLRRA